MGCMDLFKIDFDTIEWQSPMPGARCKSYVADGKQLRLLELNHNFVELHWCEKGHVGLVLEGTLEIDFHGQVVTTYKQGDGLFIRPGPAAAHKARALTPVVRLVLVEDA
jgi:hypothetical protein